MTAPSPYRFTVSVEEEYPGEWWVSLFASTDPEPDDPFVLLNWQPFPTEAEARTAAALVLAALHQATLEGDES